MQEGDRFNLTSPVELSMVSQKKNYNSEERAGLVTDVSLSRSRWLWSSRWGSDCLGRRMVR